MGGHDKVTYFEQCFGFKEYKPVLYGAGHAIHPVTIKQVFETLRGTKEADVLVSLVREITFARQRYERLHKEYLEEIEKRRLMDKQSSVVAEGLFTWTIH